jgi:hypothetical protein
MSCQDVSFERAHCRIEIGSASDATTPMFVAHVDVIEDDGRVRRPLTFADGRRIEIHGATELLALNSAVTYLESRFGGRAEPEFDCEPEAMAPVNGPPFVVDAPDRAPLTLASALAPTSSAGRR